MTLMEKAAHAAERKAFEKVLENFIQNFLKSINVYHFYTPITNYTLHMYILYYNSFFYLLQQSIG